MASSNAAGGAGAGAPNVKSVSLKCMAKGPDESDRLAVAGNDGEDKLRLK